MLPGCDACTIDATVVTPSAGVGPSASQVVGWDDDSGSKVIAALLPDENLVGLVQRENGVVVDFSFVPFDLLPATAYRIRVEFDGERFSMSVDGQSLISFANAGSRTPFGRFGFLAWGAPIEVERLHVERPVGP